MNPGPSPPRLLLTVNGTHVEIEADPSTPILYVLRNDLALNGPKYGCGLGQCGACAILVGDRIARSCVTPVGAIRGRPVVTLEGLGGRDAPGVVQSAFIDRQAAQCGYCINGMILTVHAAIHETPDIDEAGMRAALRHTLCRCGAHVEILAAAMQAAAALRSQDAAG